MFFFPLHILMTPCSIHACTLFSNRMIYSNCSIHRHWGHAVIMSKPIICCNGSLSCCMCQKGQTLCSPFHSSSSAPPSLSGLCMSCPRGAIGVCVRVFVCDQVCTRAKWTEWGGGREEWGHSFERIKLKLHVRGPLAPAPGREITVIHC